MNYITHLLRFLLKFIFSIIIILVLLLLLFLILWTNYHDKYTSLRKADAAIVLGAAAWGNNPSPVFKERINHSINLYQKNTVKYIIFTGGTPKKTFPTEAQVASLWSQKRGVLKEHILIEDNSKNTIENLQNALSASQNSNKKIDNFIIISDPYHLLRAYLIAKSLSMSVQTSATPTSLYHNMSTRNKMETILHELFAIIGFFYSMLIL